MFRMDLLSIVRSLNTVYTAIGICHASLLSASEVILTSLTDRQQFWDSWWWTVDLSETCRVLYQKETWEI